MSWELDPSSKTKQYAQDAHKLLHPNVPIRGDVCGTDTETLEYFDVFCFTPPCQSYSTNGKRKGLEDTRGTLTFDALKIVKDISPKMLFMENVKGMVNHDKGNTLSTFLFAMNEIGYLVDFKVINSKDFGVPQKRERLYVVGIRDDLYSHEAWNEYSRKSSVSTFRNQLIKDGLRTFNFDFPEEYDYIVYLEDILEENVDSKYYLDNSITDQLLIDNSLMIEEDLKMYKDKEVLLIKEATKKGYAVAEIGDSINIQFPKSKTRRGRVGKKMANTIEASTCNQAVLLKENDKLVIRKFTPREYLRLQAIPEDAIDLLVKNYSDQRLYKFAGNGLTIHVVKEIASKIKTLLESLEK